MSDDPDNVLRRSKRNKFHLDVAAIHNGRSRSPALQHLTVVQTPIITKLTPKTVTPIVVSTNTPQIVLTPVSIKTEQNDNINTTTITTTTTNTSKISKVIVPTVTVKANTIPRTTTNKNISTLTHPHQNLGKRKRKAALYDEFSYSIDSDYDSDINAVGVEYTDSSGIKYENDYPCPRCPAQFESRVGLTNHLKLHGANKTFPCHNCDFSCTNRKTMRQHKKVHGQHTPTKKRKSNEQKKMSQLNTDKLLNKGNKKAKRHFPCPWCPFKTHTFAKLIPHKIGHFKAYGYQCHHCTYRASARKHIIRHVNLHGSKKLTMENLSKIEYVLTKDPSLKPVKLNVKKINLITEKQLLKCTKCNFETNQRKKLERHQKRHKSKINQESKEEINEKTNDTLKNDKKRKTCSRCGLKFVTIGQYTVHYHRKHFKYRKSEKISSIEMHQERLGYPEFLNELKDDNTSNDIIRHVAALGPQTMTGSITPLIGGVGSFNCNECPFRATTQAKLSTHENKHKIKSDLQCSKCSYSCKTHISLVRHNALHDINSKIKDEIESSSSSPNIDNLRTSSPVKKTEASLRCPHCPYRSKHGCDMKAHQKMHSDRGTFRCPYCTYSTMRLNALKTHVSLHEQEMGHINTDNTTPTPDQPMVQKLPDKDKESEFLPKEIIYKKLWDSSKEKIIGKKIMKSNGIIIYRCSNCPYEAKYPSTLNQHVRHHIRIAKYKCPKCTFTTDRDDILPKHIDSHQNEPAPEGGWFCSVCPYRADSYGKQWHHVQKHKKIGRFNCEICKFGVGSIQSYNDHMALHGILPGTIQSSNNQQNIIDNSTTDISSIEQRTTPETITTTSSSEKDKSEERSTTSSIPGVAIAQDFEMDMDWSGTSPISTPQTAQSSASQTRTNTASPSGPITRNKRSTPLKRQLITSLRLQTQSTGPYKNNIQIYLPPIPAAIKPKRKRQISNSSSGINSIDDDEKIHECKNCPFTCLDSKMLKFHIRMHEGDRPQKCAMCTFSCFNTDALYSHMNVHAPQLPESMLSAMRKKLAQRRRNGSLHERETLPANATNVYRCEQCPFRTAYQDRYLQHRMEHVQHLQQRLMTQMKRAANDEKEGKTKKLLARKKAERKWNYCTQCSFRSDTLVALLNHQEYHGNSNNLFKCRYCNYSANNRDIVTYHENTHHMDLPATNQALNLTAINGIVDSDLLSEKRQKYSCQKCLYNCHELSDFINHFEENHFDDPHLCDIIEKLRMGLLPTLPLRTSQSCQQSIVQEQKSPNIVPTATTEL